MVVEWLKKMTFNLMPPPSPDQPDMDTLQLQGHTSTLKSHFMMPLNNRIIFYIIAIMITILIQIVMVITIILIQLVLSIRRTRMILIMAVMCTS